MDGPVTGIVRGDPDVRLVVVDPVGIGAGEAGRGDEGHIVPVSVATIRRVFSGVGVIVPQEAPAVEDP